MKAVLFDIDGTIIRAHGAGKASIIKATIDTFGTVGIMEKVNFQGKTDPKILYESLTGNGITREIIDLNINKLKKNYFKYLRSEIKKSGVTLMPGIKNILPTLSTDKNIMLGLLTGNFSESAKIKLSSHNLNKYFKVGIFGDDTAERNEMPFIAQKKICANFSIDIDFSNMVIIGDTVHDIECAKKSGAISISVGTGWTEKSILLSHNPHYYFDDFSDIELVIDTIIKC
ncbi:HAD family hydrolase [Spirochaetota bacterium]